MLNVEKDFLNRFSKEKCLKTECLINYAQRAFLGLQTKRNGAVKFTNIGLSRLFKNEKMNLFLTSLLLIGCKFNQNNKSENDYYLKTKSSFQNSLISHFPNSLTTSSRVIIDLKNIDKNDVGLILVENENSKKTIDSLELVLSELALKRYNSNDTCLFLINNFETYKSYEQRTEVQILDSFAIKKKCNDSLLPIPNFIEYSINFIAFDNTKIFLKNFDIYVIEAKSGYSFSDYKLKPNYQMPTGWENGFTRGIAINKDERIVIYYCKIW